MYKKEKKVTFLKFIKPGFLRAIPVKICAGRTGKIELKYRPPALLGIE